MNNLRRRLLQAAILGGFLTQTACDRNIGAQLVSQRNSESGGRRRSVLILGGTGFVGPHVVNRAVDRGFEVTLFNRGRTNSSLFPNLELLIGDRARNLNAIQNEVLSGRTWDAVIDLSGYAADHVADTANILSVATAQYVFISSVAAYASFDEPNTETSALHTSTGEGYGPQKAEAERRAAEVMPGRVTLLRPTFIAGPGDSTDRFTYWPIRVARGGEMLVPGPMDRPIQFIDVRDVASFTLRCVENGLMGAFNTAIAARSYTMAQLLADCESATGRNAAPVWVSPEFVEDKRIDNEDQLPIWESPLGPRRAFPLISGQKSFEHGMITRPPAETIRDTMAWWEDLPEQRRRTMRAGLPAARENELLSEWRSVNA